jgi:hypothetical protein
VPEEFLNLMDPNSALANQDPREWIKEAGLSDINKV